MTFEARHYIHSRIIVSVDLFSRDRMNITAEKSWTIGNIYTEVCDYLGIPESKVFGLAKKSNYGLIFLNPEDRLSTLDNKNTNRRINFIFPHNKHKYSLSKAPCTSENGSDDMILIFLRVRYYVPNHCLRGRVVRHLYYEQLKLNSRTYGLLCSDEVYFQLAAFSIKLELLADKNLRKFTSITKFDRSNLKLVDHFPPSMIDAYGSDYLYANVPNLLAPIKNQSRESLEWRYIRLASDPSSNFNLHLYPVSVTDTCHTSATTSAVNAASVLSSPLRPISRIRGPHSARSRTLSPSGKGNFWLGISPNGFEFHEEDEDKRMAHLNSLPWTKIDKLSRKHASFVIHLTSGRKLAFFTGSSREAQHLFTLSSRLHEYQTVAHLSSQQSARQLEQQDRLQYNEAYIYSAGEVVTVKRIPGTSGDRAGGNPLVETSESPLFPQILRPHQGNEKGNQRQFAYI